MPDGWDDWDELGFELDDPFDHADLDEEDELEEEAELEDLLVDGDGGGESWDPDWPEEEVLAGGVGADGDVRVVTAPTGHDGGGAATGTRTGEGRNVGWSAWDVGTAFALGGWLLDQHAEHVGAQVREALAAQGTARVPGGGPRGAPHPAPPSGHRYVAGSDAHEVGGPLLPGVVYAEAVAASVAGRSLLLQAEGQSPAGGRLVLIVSVVPSTAGPSMWVVAEERPDGFSAARLLPVFQRDPSGGLAIFATDDAAEVADAVAWACARENVAAELLDVVRRS
jgi:hypothetical protein